MTDTLMHFKNLSAFDDLVHFQTTRHGGFSMDELATMNTSYSVGDNPQTVLKNRMEVAWLTGIPLDRFVFPKQCHTANIAIVTERDCGRGVWFERHDPLAETDALVTAEHGIMLCIKTADCIPVLLYDPVRQVIAAIHAGWRGTASCISRKTVEMLVARFGCHAGDIVAGIGAGAGICCYETNEEFYARIVASINTPYPDFNENNRRIDLKEINRRQLMEAGVTASNIEVNPVCTICHAADHFSHRGSGGHAGRSLNGICMK